jgi:hypothetical protein
VVLRAGALGEGRVQPSARWRSSPGLLRDRHTRAEAVGENVDDHEHRNHAERDERPSGQGALGIRHQAGLHVLEGIGGDSPPLDHSPGDGAVPAEGLGFGLAV